MISPDHIRTLARYNQWQNANLTACADDLGDESRKLERGAFFGSIHATFNHLLWADQMWMSRFTDLPKPAVSIKGSTTLHADWTTLKTARIALDQAIIGWADGLDPAWLGGALTWFSGNAGRDMTAPKWLLVTHMFNHQTHHRGQIHCLLTQAGVKPGLTDLPGLPFLSEL